MKNTITYLIVAVAIFFLLFDGVSIPMLKAAPAINNMEMYFAFANAVEAEKPMPKCECGGDGDVGDGRIRVPCPCKKDGGECQCKGMEPTTPVEPATEAIPANWTYAVIITNPSWCSPCVVLKKNVLDRINENVPTNGQWKFANKEGGLTHIVVADEQSDVAMKYGPALSALTDGQNPMPIIVFIRNGQIKKCLYGNTTPRTPEQFKMEFLSVK